MTAQSTDAGAAATTPEATPEATEEIWTYCGMRHDRGDIEYHWRAANGEPMVFHKSKGPIVGARYRVQVTRKPGAGASVVPTPRFVEQEPDADVRNALIAEHRANEVAADAWKAAKQGTADAIDNMTIAELRKVMQKVPTTRRRALLATVIDRLTNGRAS